MNINIRGDKVNITESIKVYVEEKLARLEKYFKDPSSLNAYVQVRLRNGKEIIEVTIPTDKYTLRAEVRDDDLYAAIDAVIDVLERQIRKNKTKLTRHRTESNPIVFHYEDDKEDEEEEKTGEIVREKVIETKPMSPEEAVLQMELLGHDFYLFKNANDFGTSLVYKRKDGNYGLISSK